MSEPVLGQLMYRLGSFLHYPEDAFFRPPRLARMGFYSSGRGKEVTCYGCGVSHTSFHKGQNIRRAHMQKSPNCQLNFSGDDLQADDANGVNDLVPQDVPIPLLNGDQLIDEHLITYFSLELQRNIAFRRSDPSFKLLAAEGLRLRRRTFYDWPAHYGNWEQLATSGLFYTGRLDTVQCCVCSIMYEATLLQNEPDVRHTLCRKSCRRYF